VTYQFNPPSVDRSWVSTPDHAHEKSGERKLNDTGPWTGVFARTHNEGKESGWSICCCCALAAVAKKILRIKMLLFKAIIGLLKISLEDSNQKYITIPKDP
jgi:hypothetical protein